MIFMRSIHIYLIITCMFLFVPWSDSPLSFHDDKPYNIQLNSRYVFVPTTLSLIGKVQTMRLRPYKSLENGIGIIHLNYHLMILQMRGRVPLI